MGSESVSQRSMSGTLPAAANTTERDEGAREDNMAPAGAQGAIALRDQFPRFHNFCDSCGCAVTYESGYSRTARETPAGGFARCACADCERKLGKMSRPRRERAERRAMVRHAARYSPDFARFVADWYGIAATAELVGEAHDVYE
ncbi:hypothetical protein [Luteimonas sp. SDU82]|uniref:hypothetical protein n=1 Tax=Luteimonas sp. SDU82 TaxID=3422592 RepID=UPI003EBC2168